MLKIVIIFSICSLINVMLNTAKTIIMYKNEKLSSALINAITYGFYTIIVVLMAGDMDLWLKVAITTVTNFIGVWLSMLILDKLKKDKLWKVEVTIPAKYSEQVDNKLSDVPFSKIVINEKYNLYNFYCSTQNQSKMVKDIVNEYNAKYFVSESKTL